MHSEDMFLAPVSLKGILGCLFSSVTPNRCMEEEKPGTESSRLGETWKTITEFGIYERGFFSSKANEISLFQPGDLVKIFVLCDFSPHVVSVIIFTQTKSVP